MKHLPAAPIFLAVAVLGLAGTGRAQAPDSSPFVSGRSSGPGGQAPDGTSYELRGIMAMGSGFRYCIYDPAKKSTAWVGLNEPGYPFTVNSADPARDTVGLQTSDGRQIVLTLRQGKVANQGPAVSFPQPPPGVAFSQGGPPAPGPSSALATVNTVLNPTPEDNQRRLQAIAEEVRRRRMLREQAQQSPSQPPQPGMPRQQ